MTDVLESKWPFVLGIHFLVFSLVSTLSCFFFQPTRAVNNPNGKSMQSNPVEDYLQLQPDKMFSKYTIRKRCGLTKKEFQYHMRMSKHIRSVPGREVGNGIHAKRSNVIQYHPPHAQS